MRPARVRSQQQGLQRARRVQLVGPLRCSAYRFKGFVDTEHGPRAVIQCDCGTLATCDGPLSYRALPSRQRWQPAKMTAEGWVPTGDPVVQP